MFLPYIQHNSSYIASSAFDFEEEDCNEASNARF
nr:MAG TPA: hypothetical protein [Bacteriophage sp.]